jgi:hypothetical protein
MPRPTPPPPVTSSPDQTVDPPAPSAEQTASIEVNLGIGRLPGPTSKSYLSLLGAVTTLAFDQRMDCDALHAFYFENDVGPLAQGGEKPDPHHFVTKFDESLREILAAAHKGELTINARSPTSDAHPLGRYPRTFDDYKAIPSLVFIADYRLGPTDPQVLWIEGE